MVNQLLNRFKTHPFFGRGLLLLAEGLFAISFSVAKVASHTLPFNQLMWFRFAPALALIPVFVSKKRVFYIENPKLMLFRSILGVTSIFCLLLSLKLGEFGRSNVLYALGTLWAFFWSLLVLKEKPHLFTLISVPAAFLGLFLIFRPATYVFHFSDLIALIGSFLTGGVYVSLRKLRQNHSSETIVFCFFMTGFIVFSLLCLLHPEVPTLKGVLLGITVGITGFLAQLLMTTGYRYCPVSVSSFIKLLNSVLMVGIGVLIFHDNATALELLGMGLVIGSIFTITRYQ